MSSKHLLKINYSTEKRKLFMSEKTTNTLRQADNKVIVEGYVVEHKLEVRDYKRKGKDNTEFQDKGITGTVDVRTGENEVQQVRFFTYATNAQGKPNGNFKSYSEFMEKVVSQADVASGKGETPSFVRIQGSLELNEYYGQDGKLRQNPQIAGTFINMITPLEETKATFDVEAIIKSVRDEVKNDEETGRVIISAFVPLYNKIVPLEFVVGNKGADYVRDNFESSSTVNVWGKFTNFRKVTEKVTEGGFGEDKVEEKVEYLRELEITGGAVYDEDDKRSFSAEAVRPALQAREVYLAELKTKSENRNNQTQAKPDGFGGGNTGGAKGSSAPEKKVDSLFG